MCARQNEYGLADQTLFEIQTMIECHYISHILDRIPRVVRKMIQSKIYLFSTESQQFPFVANYIVLLCT